MTKYIDVEWMKDNLINRGFNEFVKNGGYPTSYSLMDFIEILNHSPAVDIPQWIPVTKRLPEEDYETGNGVQFSADVLATIVNKANDGELYVWLLKTVNGKWCDYVPNEDGTHEIPYWCEVIAWMPLLEPYKGGEEE